MHHYNYIYVLITPARNEETYIEKTIQSVISQSILPKKWIIVSDGSTDRTDEIVNQYTASNKWIELVRMPEHRDRNFAAKVNCFNAGYERIKNIKFDVIGNLDSDISFDNDYFEFLLSKLIEFPELGVIGTPFVEDGAHYNYNFTNIEHVSGACQLFRRKCFEQIGGYMPIKNGGIDWVAVTTARMKGWKTRTFTEKTCFHHRKMGTGNSSVLIAKFRIGLEDYYVGGHPLWELLKAIFQMKSKPFFLGGMFIFLGYIWSLLNRVEKPIPKELIKFHRREQMNRLKNIFYKTIKLKIENSTL